MANEPTAKKRPNCAHGTCPPARAVHAKGCLRRAWYLAGQEVEQRVQSMVENLDAPPEIMDIPSENHWSSFVPETRPQTGWRTDTKEEFEQRLKLAREMQNEIQAEKRPWWKRILHRG